jgi:Tfp pilus assembly protein PilF
MLKLLTICLILFIAINWPAGPAQARDSVKSLLKKARALVNKKQNKEAQVVFEKVLEISPRNAEAHAGLGWTLFTQGKRDLAEEEVKASLKLDDKSPMAHNVMGAIYFSKGMVEEAKHEFRTVLKLDPKRRCGGCADLRGLLGPDIPPPPKEGKGK